MSGKNIKKSTKKQSTLPNEAFSDNSELPGVDFKNKLGPRSLKHERLDLNTSRGESRFLSSVQKELSKKSNLNKLQNAFNHQDSTSTSTTAFGNKTVLCTNQSISMQLGSPLAGICEQSYVQKWRNNELIKETPVALEEDADHDDGSSSSRSKEARPSVIAVNLKWKNGIELKQCHKFTTRTRQLEPLMRKTEFDYENKTRFAEKVESACEQLFPDWKQKLMILDGNECHGQISFNPGSSSSSSSKSCQKSDKLQEDATPHLTTKSYSTQADSNTKEWREFTDLQEHKILAIPFYTKNGFDMDLSQRYQFPYQAKFVIGRKAYHHKFFLQLPISKSPQHFGLIFTFSEDAQGLSKLRIKSLLTVYSIYPETPKFACLETYEQDGEDFQGPQSKSRGKLNQSERAAKNAVQLLSDNLKEEKIVSGFGSNNFQVSRDFAQRGDNHFRNHRIDDDPLAGKKQKKKQQVLRNIKMEQARY